MKTAKDFIKEIESSAALQGEIKAIKDKGAFAELLKKYDVNATIEDFEKLVKSGSEGEIADDAAAAVAGGGWLIDAFSKLFGI